MTNLVKLREFLKKNYICLFFIGLIFFVVIFSASTLTTKPQLWVDEALTIELAHNFLKSGVLDVEVAPSQFSGLAPLLQSTGYPLTVTLALAFKFFGYNLITERILMLLFMVGCLAAIFLFIKKLFSKEKAILSVLLIVSFASFYGSGRVAVGEILGFIFLLIGLYFFIFRGAFYWSGLFLGLSIVTKPSVFLLILPAIVLVFALERQDFFKKIFKIGLGITPAIIGWVFLVLKNPFAKEVWQSLFNFYRNPYGSGSLAVNVVGNLANIIHSTTLIYFGALFFIVILGRYWLEDQKLKSFFNFVIFYSIIAFIYYLRSPGWLRYILIAELLILLTIPEALSVIFLKFKELISRIKLKPDKLAVIVVLLLAVIQFINLFTASQIFASNSAIKTASLINEKFPKKSIGVMNALSLSILLESNKKYQTVQLMGVPPIGSNFILGTSSPEVMVFVSGRELSQKENTIINNNYIKFTSINGYEIYTAKKQNND